PGPAAASGSPGGEGGAVDQPVEGRLVDMPGDQVAHQVEAALPGLRERSGARDPGDAAHGGKPGAEGAPEAVRLEGAVPGGADDDAVATPLRPGAPGAVGAVDREDRLAAVAADPTVMDIVCRL